MAWNYILSPNVYFIHMLGCRDGLSWFRTKSSWYIEWRMWIVLFFRSWGLLIHNLKHVAPKVAGPFVIFSTRTVTNRGQVLNSAHDAMRVPPAPKRCCGPLTRAPFPFSVLCGCWHHTRVSLAILSHKTGYYYIFLECVKASLEWENLVPLLYNWKTLWNLNLWDFHQKKKLKAIYKIQFV